MSEGFDPSDYSFVVKRRGSPAKPWRWEIYRAGRSGLVECSPGFFEGMAEAAKEGKKAPLDASWPNRPRDTNMTKQGGPGQVFPSDGRTLCRVAEHLSEAPSV